MKNLGTGKEEKTPLPEPLVENLENSIVSAICADVEKKASANTKFAPRIAYGEKGDKVVVWSNHFRINFKDDPVLYVYTIKLPPIKVRGKEKEIQGRKRVQLIKLLLKENQNLQGDNEGKDIVTDFHSILISRRDLGVKIDATVIYHHEDEEKATDKLPSYAVEISREEGKPRLRISSFLQYMRSTDITTPGENRNVGTLVQALNIFLNFYAKTKEGLATAGPRNVFSFEQNRNPESLGGGAVAMSGYHSSVRPAAGFFLVNVDLSYTAFHDPNVELQDLANAWSRDKHELDQFLRFVRIMTKHRDQNQVKTICGLAKPTDGRPESKDEPGSPHPPQGAKDRQKFKPIVLGAGPKDVHFWMEGDNDKGKYISVWDFFRQSELATMYFTHFETLTN